MRNIIFDSKVTQDEVKIGDIEYGTVITNVSGNPSSIYMKVNKRSAGEKINLHYPPDYSVLVNLKTGALRVIRGGNYVRVLSEKLILRELTEIPSELLK